MSQVIIDDSSIKNLPKGVNYFNNLLTIADNKIFKEPLIIKYNNLSNPNLEIEVGESTEVKIILELNNQETKINYNFKLTLSANSKVTYLFIGELTGDLSTINHELVIKKDASLELMGGFLSENLNVNLQARLIEENSSVHVRAVVISAADDEQIINVNLFHEAPYSTGLMHNIAIAGGNGRVVLNGVANILNTMSKSNSYQNLKGIITSNDAVIEVNPILLIDEYDVTAGHGATVGKLDELSIYYLMSRGLTRKAAEVLMINGLLRPLVDEISDEDIKERFVKLVNEKL